MAYLLAQSGRAPELAEREVHVWLASLELPVSAMEDLGRCLAEGEWERARRFLFTVHRDRFVAARGLLRQLLGEYLGRPPEGFQFQTGEHGKPFLDEKQAEGLHFNVSHSDNLAAFAFARGFAVGVDVEKAKAMRDLDAVAARILSRVERGEFERLSEAERRETFFRVWTRKEAVMKCLGTGFSMPPSRIEVTFGSEDVRLLRLEGSAEKAAGWSLVSLPMPAGFAGTVAAVCPDLRCQVFRNP